MLQADPPFSHKTGTLRKQRNYPNWGEKSIMGVSKLDKGVRDATGRQNIRCHVLARPSWRIEYSVRRKCHIPTEYWLGWRSLSGFQASVHFAGED
jgi:hypothetical protein